MIQDPVCLRIIQDPVYLYNIMVMIDNYNNDRLWSIILQLWPMKSRIITWVCTNSPRVQTASVPEKLYMRTELTEIA